MSSELASTVGVEVMLAEIETAITAAPSLSLTIADDLRGFTSATTSHRNVRVSRESTRNLEETRNQLMSAVEDIVLIQLGYRVAPKDQRTSRNSAHLAARQLRNRVTQLGHPTLHRYNVRHMTTSERVNGEWIEIDQRYRFRRNESVGAGI